MKKALILLIVVLFAFSFSTTGCKKKAPPPKPTPLPTSTPVPHLEKIVFTFNGNLYWMESDGKGKEELFADGKSKWFPSVSPNGWYVAYWVQENGNYNMWLGDFKKKNNYQITFDEDPLEGDIQKFTMGSSVAWSNDSQNIIYSRYKDIWQITKEGYNPIALTNSRDCISPALSKDNKLVYAKIDRPDTYNLYIKDIYSMYDERLTDFVGQKAGAPAFSPDGKSLFFNVIDGETVNVYKIDNVFAKSGSEIPVGNDGRSHSPVYSYYGTKVIFSSYLSDKYKPQIWSMSSSGSDRQKLTEDGGVSPSYLYRLLSEPLPTRTPEPKKVASDEKMGGVFDVENEPVPTVDMSSVEEPSQEDPRVDISDYTDGDLSVKTVQKGDKLLFYPVIQFDSGIANIKSDYYDVMDDMYKIISKYQSPIVVMGHTDNQPIATAAYPSNKELSIARANAVKAYLVSKHGVDASRITIKGYGESNPLVPNDSVDNMYKNRRAEIYLKTIKMKPTPVPTVVASTKPAAKPTPIKAKKGKKVKKKDIKSGGW